MILCISTSLSRFCVCLGNRQNQVLYYDEQQKQLALVPDLSQMIKAGLDQLGRKVKDIEEIFVDIGPGGTSSVRTGVAIANGMAYALKVPVAGISSIEIVGLGLRQKYELPVVILHKAIRENYYVGIYEDAELTIHYGKLSDLQPKVAQLGQKLVMTGSEKGVDRLRGMLSAQDVLHTDEKYANPSIICKNYERFADRLRRYPQLAVPITEDQLENHA